MKVVFPDACVEYISIQCNNDLAAFEECAEIEHAKEILQNIKPKNVIEIGAGLGRVSVFLKNKFNWVTTNFYLLDGDSGHAQIAGMHEAVGNDYYNSIKATKSFCKANGIPEEKLRIINAENSWKHNLQVKFDLCYSFKSMGFHWPITSYLIDLYEFLNPKAYLIFEMRSTDRTKYETDIRWNRAKRFVQRQIDNINEERYEIIKLQVEKDHPILVLQRI